MEWRIRTDLALGQVEIALTTNANVVVMFHAWGEGRVAQAHKLAASLLGPDILWTTEGASVSYRTRRLPPSWMELEVTKLPETEE